MINVAAVSYLNTKPLLYGIENGSLKEQMNLFLDYPSKIAQGLIDGKYDIGLVPVAIIPYLPQWEIIGSYGIAAHGPVASVSIFSEKPIDQLKTIYLDYQSRTSVQLAQILVKHYLKLEHINFLPAPENYIDLINHDIGGVIIGDRALKLKNKFKYDYDLAEHWHQFTGLPFVFATWIATQPLPESFILDFNQANGLGMQHLNEIIEKNYIDYYDLHQYYTKDIQYHIGALEQEGMNKFLSYIK